MDAILLSLIAGILYAGFVLRAWKDAEVGWMLLILPILAVIAATAIFLFSLFIWRYEYVFLGSSASNFAQEGDFHIFGSGTNAMTFVMRNGQWVPQPEDPNTMFPGWNSTSTAAAPSQFSRFSQ